MKRILPICVILITLLLSSCTNEDSSVVDIGTKDKPDVVYVTDTGEKYHSYGCRYLKYSSTKKDIQQAIKQGYTPCSICIEP